MFLSLTIATNMNITQETIFALSEALYFCLSVYILMLRSVSCTCKTDKDVGGGS